MKTSELVKLLKLAGCRMKEHGKKHDAWYSPITKKEFQVPRHQNKEMPKGTEIKIRKDAGLN